MVQRLLNLEPRETPPNKQHLRWLPWEPFQSVQESNGTPALLFQKKACFLYFNAHVYFLQYQHCISKNYRAQNVNIAFTGNFFPIYINNTSLIPDKFKKQVFYQKFQTFLRLRHFRKLKSNSPTMVIPTPSWVRHTELREDAKHIYLQKTQCNSERRTKPPPQQLFCKNCPPKTD